MRRLAFLSVLAVVALAAVPAQASRHVSVTVVGDSAAASIAYTPSAQKALRRGLDVRLDLEVCRRLVLASCAWRGVTPPTALEAVQRLGRGVGDVLVVYVGYNDWRAGYAPGIDRMVRAATAQGASRIVWVTLREVRPGYRELNAAIRAAASRWPQLRVADWNAYSAGKPWFGSDGLHMSAAGAEGLARFLRQQVLRAPA